MPQLLEHHSLATLLQLCALLQTASTRKGGKEAGEPPAPSLQPDQSPRKTATLLMLTSESPGPCCDLLGVFRLATQ